MTLEQLRIFVKVVQTGSFTKAADALVTQKSHVSRVVQQLEAHLGARLLERSTRALAVTEMGREVFERAVGILAAVEDTARMVQSIQGEPRGVLRVTAGVEFGQLAVGGWIDEYLQRYPGVSAEVEYTSRLIDVVHEGFDVAIRVGPLQEPRLVARRLGELEYGVFACPKYLAAQGTPASVDELKSHSLVMFNQGSHRKGWQLAPRDKALGEPVKVDGPARLRVNNSFAVRDTLLNSLGIGVLPLVVAQGALAAGRLRPVLPGWAPEPVPVHALYASTRYLSPKLKAFIDIAMARFNDAGQSARQAVAQACAV
jgi:DNA-binding transcriptional LysR family regulator